MVWITQAIREEKARAYQPGLKEENKMRAKQKAGFGGKIPKRN